MTGTEKIKIAIHLGDEIAEVGEMVTDRKNIFFRYNPSFIEKRIEISPFKLPLSTEIHTANPYPFEGLFGVFYDSLPDGWGRLLLDRTLLKKGLLTEQVTPLDRLAIVGKKGMGALIYEPEFNIGEDFRNQPDLDDIAREVEAILHGDSSGNIEALYQAAGSSGGARPKILTGFNPLNNQIIPENEILPEGFEHWLVKFSSSADKSDAANIEFAFYKMALEAGIEMSPCNLFTGKSGRVYFGTKRFDRAGNQKIHLHSASGLLHDNFRQSTMDYGHLMDCAFRLENHINAYRKILRLAAFNVFSHNRDDHSRNFAFLMDASGDWKLAPAFDLTFSTSAFGMHSTSVAGETKSPGRTQLMELANHFKIKNAPEIIEQVVSAVRKWPSFAEEYGVSSVSISQINSVIKRLTA
ncbi:MAG TPA: type II toxin-antitoxin system HipA family toxin [Prolixibacteraceae bacterium]|nr:type II toxin-antitoxin system HipA family toxin [Prolixibacteraceae bacterium]